MIVADAHSLNCRGVIGTFLNANQRNVLKLEEGGETLARKTDFANCELRTNVLAADEGRILRDIHFAIANTTSSRASQY